MSLNFIFMMFQSNGEQVSVFAFNVKTSSESQVTWCLVSNINNQLQFMYITMSPYS